MDLNHYLDSLGSKGLLQPTLSPTLAWAICTLIEYAIFAHPVPDYTLDADDQYNQLERFIVQDHTDWAKKKGHELL